MTQSWRSQSAAVAAMAGVLTLALALRGGAAGGASAAWADAVESGADHIRVDEFAQRMASSANATVVVDLRPASEFAAFHLVRSVRMSVPELLGAPGAELLGRSRDQLVVLVSNGMTHPGQAWVELTRRGHRNVRVLEGGLTQLQDEVLTPPSLRGVTTAARAAAELPAWREATASLLGQQPASRPVASQPAARSALATDPPRLTAPTVVSTSWVARRGADVVLLDTREKPEDYGQGHLHGARHLPVAQLREKRAGNEDLLPAAELARRFGGLGIRADQEVVAYAGEKLQDATQVLLALVQVGHRAVAVMDGGIGAWRAEGRPLATDSPVAVAVGYTAQPLPPLAEPLAAVVAAHKAGKPAILDVRPADGFRGEKSTEARPGHIPGSLHRPYTEDVVNRDGGTFLRPRSELLAGYQRLGLLPDQPLVVTCRTGHQASQTWFVLRYLLGHPDVRWYDGSWQEWAAHPELPAETGGGGR